MLDQRGTARPLPAGSLPDLGAVELNQPLSTGATVNNDMRSGTNAANNLTGLAGNDYLKGLGGNDTMDGGNGSDVLDGGPGNDKLTGGTGLDLVAYPGAIPAVNRSQRHHRHRQARQREGHADRHRRGVGLERRRHVQGRRAQQRVPGQGRQGHHDRRRRPRQLGLQRGGRQPRRRGTGCGNGLRAGPHILDPGQDTIDLIDIDADTTVPGNQSFRWIGKAALKGAAQLGYFVSGGNTIVRASTDADAAPEVEIQLTGTKTLTEADFRP